MFEAIVLYIYISNVHVKTILKILPTVANKKHTVIYANMVIVTDWYLSFAPILLLFVSMRKLWIKLHLEICPVPEALFVNCSKLSYFGFTSVPITNGRNNLYFLNINNKNTSNEYVRCPLKLV